MNKYKTGENHLGDKESDLEETDDEDDDFKQGLDFNDMKFDDSQKVNINRKHIVIGSCDPFLRIFFKNKQWQKYYLRCKKRIF